MSIHKNSHGGGCCLNISRQDAQLSKDILSGSHTWYFEALEWLDIEFRQQPRSKDTLA
jgi:hypothetical protein